MRNVYLVTLLPVCRQTALYSPELEPGIVLIEPQSRHRSPSAWMILCTQGGSITLRWVAELTGFSTVSQWRSLGKRLDHTDAVVRLSGDSAYEVHIRPGSNDDAVLTDESLGPLVVIQFA